MKAIESKLVASCKGDPLVIAQSS
ncbi:hypothetical protein NC651_027903 [Populus alba x Populus x berolinensis]|nr:hypothetical protein NC651_027903 [Populus alba x Populus x berolinensis]